MHCTTAAHPEPDHTIAQPELQISEFAKEASAALELRRDASFAHSEPEASGVDRNYLRNEHRGNTR